MIGGGQVEPGAAGLQRQHHCALAAAGLEGVDHAVAGAAGQPAVVALDRLAGALAQVGSEALPPGGEVGEDQHPLVAGEDRLDDLVEPGQLAGAPVEAVFVGAVVHRVVADLLEGGDGGEHRALALGRARLAGRGGGDEVVEHRLVEPDLLGGHGAVVELVDAVGQLLGDGRLVLGAAVDQDAVERPQSRLAVRRGAVARAVAGAVGRGRAELGDELRPRAQQAGVGPVQDRPEIAEAVLDRRAGERQAGAGLQATQLLGGLRRGILDGLGLVDDDLAPFELAELVHVAQRRAVGGDHQIGVCDGRLECGALGSPRPVMHQEPHVGHETAGLRGPVAHHRRRGHDQRRTVLG